MYRFDSDIVRRTRMVGNEMAKRDLNRNLDIGYLVTNGRCILGHLRLPGED